MLNFSAILLLKIVVYCFPSLLALCIIFRIGSWDLIKEFYISWIIIQLVWLVIGDLISHWLFIESPKKTKEA